MQSHWLSSSSARHKTRALASIGVLSAIFHIPKAQLVRCNELHLAEDSSFRRVFEPWLSLGPGFVGVDTPDGLRHYFGSKGRSGLNLI